MRKTLLIVLTMITVVATLLLGLGSSPANSSPGPPSWVNFPLPSGVNPGLTVRETVRGQAIGNGCLFSFSGIATPGSPGVERDEVAFNQAACQAVYAVGPIQHDPSDGQMASSSAGGTNTSTATALTSAKVAAPDAACCDGGGNPTIAYFLKTYYEDPATLDVSSLRNDVEWTYDASGCNRAYAWKRSAGYYSLSGWWLRYSDDRPGFGCQDAISNSDALMENDIFPACLVGESAYTHYNFDHKVDGKPSGNAYWSYHDYVDSTFGVCSRLLSHHASMGWEVPW